MSARKFDLNVAKKYGNVTVVFGGDSVDVYLYTTKIVSVHEAGHVVLHSGGWLTSTTKTAMNTALRQIEALKDVQVFQKKNVWYVSMGDKVVPYEDGMCLMFSQAENESEAA